VKTALWVALGIVLGFAASTGIQTIMGAVAKGKEKRFIADASRVVEELRAYRDAHAEYPLACDGGALSARLGPKNMVARLGEANFQYCSDGAQYVLAFTPLGSGSYSSAYGAPLVYVNDRWVAWPRANTSGDSVDAKGRTD
jgi:hypothetical protein